MKHSKWSFPIFFAGSLFFASFFLRLFLFFKFGHGATFESGSILKCFLIGAHLDLFVALAWTVMLLIGLTLWRLKWRQARWARILFYSGLTLFWVGQIFFVC